MFRRIKQAAEVALDLSSGELEVGVDQNIPPVEPGPNASSLEEIARLAALPEPRGRAIVQRNESGVADQEAGSRTLIDRTSVSLTLRLRHADGSFGPRSQHTSMVPRDAALLLTPGTEIPVLLDPETGAVDRIDKDAMVEELRPRFAEAREAEKARRKRGVGFVAGALREAVSDLRSDDMVAGQPAVEGVTADQWLLVRTALRRPVPEAVRDRVTAQYGVPPGRWEAVDAEWSARAASDPDLAERLARIG